MEKERNYDTPRDCIDRFREEYEFLSNFYPESCSLTGSSMIILSPLIRHRSWQIQMPESSLRTCMQTKPSGWGVRWRRY